jgi:two-component system phosphate regulon sensor histidine kinase PhoR
LYIYYAIASDNGFVVRSSYPLSRHYELLSKVRKNILGSLLLSGFLALAAGIIGSRRITRPILKLIAATHSADMGHHAVYPTEGTSEILELSRVLSKSAQTQAEMMDELRNERNQLDTIVQSAPCGLMLLDAGGTVICANRFFAPLMRTAPDDTAGMHADGELRSPELIEIISEARRGGVSANNFAYHQNGAETFYAARAVPTGTGEMLVVLNDETERKKMETARKTFVADAGHEFQTPLTAISAAAELLGGMESSTAPERAPYIEEIMRQRERMTVLVDDLLLLSRLESGTPYSGPERFDLSEMCRVILRDAMKSPLAANISWSGNFPADDVYFEGRPEEIKRAVSNLLDNAVKYVRKRYKDRVGGHVAFSLEVSGAGLLLRVEDNGVGIPAAKLGRIFGRFERVEDDRARDGEKTGGYGLGLAIAKHAVESHGGHVDVSSSGDATVFTVRLPSSGSEAR